jgi:hypothetical protein
LVARAGAHAASLDTCDIPEAVPLAEQLETTDGRWVPARDLAEGDAVRTMSPQGFAGTATITKIRGRHEVVPVHNLTVEGTSRYLVGACGVVVHNKGDPPVKYIGRTEDLYFKRRARKRRADRFRVNALASRPGRSRFAACVRAFATRGCVRGGLAGWVSAMAWPGVWPTLAKVSPSCLSGHRETFPRSGVSV